MATFAETIKSYRGQWVSCHSIYGYHHGVLHRILKDGVILIHTVQLTDHDAADGPRVTAEAYNPDPHDADITPAQFFLPAPGLFIPYGGLFGIWPRFVPFI